ncbi:MAG: TonB-dependent receptor [Chitinispirillia bacterium]|nr:TonB-dependent receptor [Chitinispirillia bacterium]
MAKSYLRNKNENISAVIMPFAKRSRMADNVPAGMIPAAEHYLSGKARRSSRPACMSAIRGYPRNIIIAALTVIFVLALCKPASASQDAGLPGAVFRLPAGAWASGMGGAVSANPDYMLSWYNPSQLPQLRGRRASMGAGIRSLGRSEAWASYDFRVPQRMGMGLSLVYRGDHFIDGLYDGYYRDGEVIEERELNRAAFSAVSVKVGAGYLLSRRWSLGGSLGINYQSLPTAPHPDGSVYNTSVTSIGALDAAASYKMTTNLTLSVTVKNLLAGSRNDWVIDSFNDFSPIIEEVFPPIFVLSSSHRTKLLERELVWSADAEIYLFDGQLKYTGHPEILAAAGARWKFTDDIILRAGLADIGLYGDIFGDSYGFAPRFTAGFSYSLSMWMKGAFVNYALMTDRIWAGVDQQFDITVSF